SIERLPQPGFKILENGDDLFDSLLVDHTVWSVDEQTNVFVELNVWSQLHRWSGLSHNPAARTSNFVLTLFPPGLIVSQQSILAPVARSARRAIWRRLLVLEIFER